MTKYVFVDSTIQRRICEYLVGKENITAEVIARELGEDRRNVLNQLRFLRKKGIIWRVKKARLEGQIGAPQFLYSLITDQQTREKVDEMIQLLIKRVTRLQEDLDHTLKELDAITEVIEEDED